jgi:hypothetical protein
MTRVNTRSSAGQTRGRKRVFRKRLTRGEIESVQKAFTYKHGWRVDILPPAWWTPGQRYMGSLYASVRDSRNPKKTFNDLWHFFEVTSHDQRSIESLQRKLFQCILELEIHEAMEFYGCRAYLDPHPDEARNRFNWNVVIHPFARDISRRLKGSLSKVSFIEGLIS